MIWILLWFLAYFPSLLDDGDLPTEVLIAMITINASAESAVISELNLLGVENETTIFGGNTYLLANR